MCAVLRSINCTYLSQSAWCLVRIPQWFSWYTWLYKNLLTLTDERSGTQTSCWQQLSLSTSHWLHVDATHCCTWGLIQILCWVVESFTKMMCVYTPTEYCCHWKVTLTIKLIIVLRLDDPCCDHKLGLNISCLHVTLLAARPVAADFGGSAWMKCGSFFEASEEKQSLLVGDEIHRSTDSHSRTFHDLYIGCVSFEQPFSFGLRRKKCTQNNDIYIWDVTTNR